MSSAQRQRVSAFEIPLIIDLICETLSQDQVLACAQVSHLWHDAFQPQLDRFVRLNNNPRINQQHTQSVLDRATRIRSLQIDISDGGWFLDNGSAASPGQRLVNLEELSCVDFNYLPRPGKGEEGSLYHTPDRPSIIDQSSNALRLIGQNPNLRSLFVSYGRQFYRTDHFSPEILTAISNHKSLTRIRIHLDHSVGLGFRANILQHLPETIEDFELICHPVLVASHPTVNNRPRTTAPLSLKRLCLSSRSPQSASTASSLSSLSSSYWDQATFSECAIPEYHYYDRLIIPLVKRSPQLEKFAIAGYHGYPNLLMQVLVDFCPDLDTIHLGGSRQMYITPRMRLPRDIPFLDDHDEVEVQDRTPLRGVFQKLKEFRTSGYSHGAWAHHGHEDVTGLIARSTETLERVWMKSDDYSFLPSPFVAGHREGGQSWADCRHLKELAILPCSRVDLAFFDRDNARTRLLARTDSDAAAGSVSGDIANSVNDINTNFESLEVLQLKSLADSNRNECVAMMDYSHWSKNPSPGDHLNLPFYLYQDHHLRENRCHRIQFIHRVRELFGRLKAIKTLKKVHLVWSELCFTVKAMTEEVALELLQDTELVQDHNQDQMKEEGTVGEGNCCSDGREEEKAKKSSARGWYGPMTREDLLWLGLQWPTLAEVQARHEADVRHEEMRLLHLFPTDAPKAILRITYK